MGDHIVSSYDIQLKKVKDNILNMSLLVLNIIKLAGESLLHTDTEYAKQANLIDEKINYFDLDTENIAMSILALRQPMAIDFRQTIAALKSAVILERIGDLAKKICNRCNLLQISKSDNIEDVNKMVSINIEMLENTIKAYEKLDAILIKDVVAKDKLLDELYKKLLLKLEDDIVNSLSESKLNLQIIFIIKNLERIGDYIVKFALLTDYYITGQRKDIANE